MESKKQQVPPPCNNYGMTPQMPQQAPKKKKKMWLWVLLGVFVFIILPAMFGDAESAENDVEKSETAQVQQEKTDSIVTPIRDLEKAKQLEKKFMTKTDEFTNVTWVEPKSQPKYINTTGIYSYFSMQDSVPQNMRFVIQYGADNWLFIESYTFLIDGKPYEFSNPKVKRDNNSTIWEWSDTGVLNDGELLIIYAKLLDAKEAKIRFNGKMYHKDYTIPQSALQSLRDTKDYYVALGGK